nr:AAA family ATPase [Actinomycetota bacterium]
GMGAAEIAAALHVANRDRCSPPLPERDVERIAASVGRYQPETQEPVQAEPFELSVLTARQLCALPDPPTSEALLGELVVRGYRTVVGGDSGAGKTTFALAVVAAIVRGEEFLGLPGAGGCHALVLDLEQGLRTVKRRLREAGLDTCDELDYVRVPDGLALDRREDEVAAIQGLLERGRYDVVLLDPWYKAHGGDSNAEREVVDLMRLLDRWRELYGFALLLPMHTRKPPASEPASRRLSIHDVFGSGASVRGAENVLGLQVVDDGYSRLYFWKLRDGDEAFPVGGDPWGLLFSRELGYRRDPADSAPARDVPAEVEEYLLAHPRSTTNEVAKGVGAGKDKVSSVLKQGERFTFEPGPNRSRLWVVCGLQNHPDHLFPAEAVRVVPEGWTPPLRGAPSDTTDHRGGSQ